MIHWLLSLLKLYTIKGWLPSWINKPLTIDWIFTAVSNQVERLTNLLTYKLTEKDAQIKQITTKREAMENECDDVEQF